MTENQGIDLASQRQENVLQNINIQDSSNVAITFAPTQNTVIETQIIQISVQKVTQQPLIKASPYKGLNRFNATDRDRFYGRDKLIKRLLEAINTSGLILVAGASGSGKSSVIRAGVIPELKHSLSNEIIKDFIFTPSQDPFESLYRCLLNEEKDYHFSESDAQIVLTKTSDALLQVVDRLKDKNERWLLLIDQFEEIFTNCGDETIRQNFIEGIVKIAKSGNQSVRIILSMRADFLEQFSFYPALGSILEKNNIHLVTEMHPDELRQAIEQPAAKHGVVFETGLVEQIIQDVRGQKGYLPLLQYSLNLLWEIECKTQAADGRPLIEDRTLNISTYNQLEGVRGALQTRVDKIYRDLSTEQRSLTKQIFLRLVNIVDTDGGSRPVSRRANQNEFADKDIEKSLLATFVKENLLVTSTEYQSTEGIDFKGNSGKKQFATVEIAHEVLLSSWGELKRWLEEEKETIILKNYLADETNRWQRIKQENNQAKTRAELLKGARLEQLYTLREAKAFDKLGGLSAIENEFIDASFQWNKQQESQAKRRRQITIGTLTSFLVIVSGLALTAWRSSVNQSFVSASYKMQSLLSANLQLESLVEAVDTSDKLEKNWAIASADVKALVSTSMQKIVYSIKEQNRLLGHTRDVATVAFSADGKFIATGSYDTTVKIWNSQGKELQTLKGHTDVVTGVGFSPDGKYVATASIDKTLIIWNMDGKIFKTIKNGEGFNSLAFSPDSKQIATANLDKTATIWNVEGNESKILKGHTSDVTSVVFSSDGKQVATASADRTVKIWSLDGQELQSIQSQAGEVMGVAFSPDSKLIATANTDNTIRILGRDGKELRIIKGHGDLVTGITFAPDGKKLASASADKTVKIWDLEGKELATLQGHSDAVRSIAFSPDGKYILSGSSDKTAKIWNVNGIQRQVLVGHSAGVRSIAFSPDGKKLVSASADKTLKIWEDGKELQTLKGHDQVVRSVAFSADGKIIASASSDDTVKIWSADGKELATLTGHKSVVNSVAISPDSQQLASASLDETIKLWNVEGKELQTISQEQIGIVLSLAFSPKGKQLALANSKNSVMLWNIEEKKLQILGSHSEPVNSIVFSPDGNYIASASSDKNIKIWSADGKEIRSLKGHSEAVTSVTFSPDSKQLASASSDKSVKIWSVDGQELQTFTGHIDGVSAVVYAPDGKQLASASNDKTIIIWNINSQSLKELGCSWLQDYISTQPDLKQKLATCVKP